MANDNIQFTQKSVESAQSLLADLKARAKQAEQESDVFTFSILNDLIKATAPIVTRAFMRLQREELARINKAHAGLRAKLRRDDDTSSDE
jgi:hypothetical protein